MKTTLAKPHEVERTWYVIDAEGQTLGRMATKVATILRGKHKPIYTPHVDTGDFVIVINAEKIQLTGKKLDQKLYRHHSQHPGGMKEVKYRDLLRDKPEFAIQHAVKGMLPKNVMGRQMLSKLKVYQGTEHSHEAQNPVPYKG